MSPQDIALTVFRPSTAHLLLPLTADTIILYTKARAFVTLHHVYSWLILKEEENSYENPLSSLLVSLNKIIGILALVLRVFPCHSAPRRISVDFVVSAALWSAHHVCYGLNQWFSNFFST